MAYYSYYQNSQPTWGTQQYQSVAPPMPQYQPQPSWHGADYYRAHAGSPDNTLFDYVWSKVRNLVTGTGVGRNEAHHWWKRVYGGLVNPSKLLPREIGAAAAYETIRFWEHHQSIYVQPLSEDREREREALIGLATAEASRLWAYTQRPLDKYGRMEASEVAASTAARIFTQTYDYDSPYEAYDRYPRARRRSISTTRYGANTFMDDDDFDDDDDDLFDRSRSDYIDAYPRRSYGHHHHHHGHRRSSSMYRRSPSPVAYGGRRSVSPMAIGAVTGLSSAAISPYDSQYATGGSPYGLSSNIGLGAGIPGTYYPAAAGAYQQSGHYSPYGGMAGGSPYLNRTYAGSSVGLPPPPSSQYLSAPPLTHRRSHSVGAYGATRPSFGY